MGANPNIRVKGMSHRRYNFLWDPEIRHYAYTPESQKEADDIFRTQGKLYRSMFFSVWLDKKEEPVKKTLAEAEVKTTKPKAKSRKKKQPVEKELEPA